MRGLILGSMIDSFADQLFSVLVEIEVPPPLHRPSRVLTSIKVPPKVSSAHGKIDGIIISSRIKIAAD